MNVREATRELHDKVEQTAFAQRLLSGDFTKQDYLNYLMAQYYIFNEMEIGPVTVLPHASLFRCESIFKDIAFLDATPDLFLAPKSAHEYCYHIRILRNVHKKENENNSHIYLNYLGLMFGGAIVAKQIPTEGNMYKFDNRTECIKSIRELPLDVEEVNRGFEYHIRIMEELEAMRNES